MAGFFKNVLSAFTDEPQQFLAEVGGLDFRQVVERISARVEGMSFVEYTSMSLALERLKQNEPELGTALDDVFRALFRLKSFKEQAR